MKQKVYIIKAGNFYKIGISNDVKQRLKGIQTANAQKCTLIATLECQNAQAKELEIHKYLSEFRANGEWFMLNDRKLNEIVKMYNFIECQNAKKAFVMPDFDIDFSCENIIDDVASEIASCPLWGNFVFWKKETFEIDIDYTVYFDRIEIYGLTARNRGYDEKFKLLQKHLFTGYKVILTPLKNAHTPANKNILLLTHVDKFNFATDFSNDFKRFNSEGENWGGYPNYLIRILNSLNYPKSKCTKVIGLSDLIKSNNIF